MFLTNSQFSIISHELIDNWKLLISQRHICKGPASTLTILFVKQRKYKWFS